ncbi:MAG: hypothetical protein AAGA87_10470 [Pseudomonadota bacterium]
MAKDLIVTPDLSSGGMVQRLLKMTGRSTTGVFACFEDMTFGPLVPTVEPEELLRLRHRHWCRSGLSTARNRPRGSRPLRALLTDADRVEIMVGGEGREQLFLLSLATLLRKTAREGRVVSLFQYPAESSLSMLNLEALAKRPKPTVLDRKALNQLLEVWDIIVSDTPKPVFDLRNARIDSRLPTNISRALDDLILSYPHVDSGLTFAQERLLTALPTDWTNAAKVVGDAMLGAMREGRSIGDGLIYMTLLELSDQSQPTPAIKLRGDRRTARACEVRRTAFGEACLNGEANNVSTNGIDTWVAGVHLNSMEGRVWFRNSNGTLA